MVCFFEQFTQSRVQCLHGEAELHGSSRRDDNMAPLHKLLLPFDVVSFFFFYSLVKEASWVGLHRRRHEHQLLLLLPKCCSCLVSFDTHRPRVCLQVSQEAGTAAGVGSHTCRLFTERAES